MARLITIIALMSARPTRARARLSDVDIHIRNSSSQALWLFVVYLNAEMRIRNIG